MMMNAWGDMQQQRNNGRISGEPGSTEFKKCLRNIRNDPGLVELIIDPMELDIEHTDRLRRLILSREWKSVTLNDLPSSNSSISSSREELEEEEDGGGNGHHLSVLIAATMNQSIRLEFHGGIERLNVAQSFSTGLQSTTCHLKKLSFINTKFTVQVADTIGVAVRSSPALEEFALTDCIINCEALWNLIGNSNSRLRALYLCDCYLKDEHVEQIGAALVHHPHLKQLWLNGTKQEFANNRPLLEGLKIHTELEHMQLPSSSQGCCPRMRGYMELNRGGRRLLGYPNASLALWPLVLERVSRVDGLNAKSRANILYFFVHELNGREQIQR